jgi:hypothetical protein
MDELYFRIWRLAGKRGYDSQRCCNVDETMCRVSIFIGVFGKVSIRSALFFGSTLGGSFLD